MTRLYILTAVGIVAPLAIAAVVAWLIDDRPKSYWDWNPHDTGLDSFMRRRRWYGWQTRRMTQEELRAHVESRLRCWLGLGFSCFGRAQK
jgi:hypothetical protein